jgi:hypothetical protein
MLCAPLLDYDGGVKSKYVELCMMCGTLSNMCDTWVEFCVELCEIMCATM